MLTGSTEGGNWASYLKSVDKVTAPDDKTVVLELGKPNATLPLLPIPIVPEHVWINVSEDEVKTYPADTERPAPVVGSGPFRLVEGKAGGSTYRFETNPDYWGGTPHVDQVVFRVYKSADPAVQALIKGEVDFVEGIKPLQVKALQGQEGITAHNGVSPLYEEIGFNTGAVDPKTGKPMGDGNPALKDPKFRHALGYALDIDRIVKTAFQGGGVVGDTIIPGFYDKWHWDVPADQAFSFDLDKAGQLLDDAGYKKGADGLRTMPDGSPIGTLRLYARSEAKESVDTMDFFKEWLGELGIKSEVTAFESNRLGEIILDGNYDAFQWDWYVEPDPDSIARRPDLRPAGVAVGLVVLQQEVRQARRGPGHRDRRDQARRDGQEDAADPLRGLAVPRADVHHPGRGHPQRPVRVPPAAARPGWRLADPVRRPQLHDRAPGRPGRRLRRRRVRGGGHPGLLVDRERQQQRGARRGWRRDPAAPRRRWLPGGASTDHRRRPRMTRTARSVDPQRGYG